jgi:hypothetical protein
MIVAGANGFWRTGIDLILYILTRLVFPEELGDNKVVKVDDGLSEKGG